jgi:hypothetical protein
MLELRRVRESRKYLRASVMKYSPESRPKIPQKREKSLPKIFYLLVATS